MVDLQESISVAEVSISPEPRAVRQRRGRRTARPALKIVLGAIIPVGFVVWWWYDARYGGLNAELYSSPSAIVKLAQSMWSAGTLQSNLVVSLRRVAIGFGIGSGIAVALGLITGFWPRMNDLLDPTIQIFRAVPIVALLPLFVVWFGFGEMSKEILIILGVAPRTYVATYTAIVNVDKRLLELAHVYRLNRLQTVRQVVLPTAAPYIFNALRLGVVTSFLLLIFAESVNANSGLGYLANQGMNNLDSNLILLAAVLYAILGLLADLLVRLVERLATPWNAGKARR